MSHDLQLAFAQETYEACEHRCAVCGYEGPHLQAHHVVKQQTLRRNGLSDFLWEPDNGLLVCCDPAPERCHERHTLAFRRIPRAALRPANEAFAYAHGLVWILEREYSEEVAA